jgi:hypothetical protein
MNFRLTAILFGTIFLLGLVLLIMSYTGDNSPQTDILLEEFAALKPGDVDTLELEREGGGTLKIKRVDKEHDRWNIVEPFTATADAHTVGNVITALLKAKPTAYPGLTSNPAAHGLSPPGIRVTLRAGERSTTVNLGDVTIGGPKGVVFVTTSARPKRPMAVTRGTLDALFRGTGDGKAQDLVKWVNDFRVRSVFATNTTGGGEDVEAITLAYKGSVLSLERYAGGWRFLVPQNWGSADPVGDPSAAFTGVSQLVGTLTNMQALDASDFVDNPTPQQLTEFGLDDKNPDRIKVDLRNRNGESTTVFIGKKDTNTPPTPADFTPRTGKWWVKVEGQPGVIRANAGDLGGLTGVITNPDPLRERNLFNFDKTRIDGLDLANGAVKLRKLGSGPAGSWMLYGNPAAGDPTPAVGVDKILDVLTARRIIKSFPVGNPAKFDGGVTVLVWADGFEPSFDPKPDSTKADPKAEPKEKGKPVTLTFGVPEGDSINVRRVSPDGKTTDYFLLPQKVKVASERDPVDLMATIKKTRLELLNPVLKTFASTMANKLTVIGVADYELALDEKPDPSTNMLAWRFVKSENRKGQIADVGEVNRMLALLANEQSAREFIDETPDAAKLAEYGLGPVVGRPAMPGDPPAPRLKVTVGLKDGGGPADKERVYEFGNPRDANFVYARQAGRKEVFTLPKSLFDMFANADLRDRSLFRFDLAAAKSISFKGWKGGGFFVELQFDKNKDGVWTATKAPGGFVVNSDKVNEFLFKLSQTRVKEFVKGPPTAEMGFGDEKESWNMHLKIDNHPDIILDIWKLTPDGEHYFAGVSLPGEPLVVVKLDAKTLKPYKESSGAFAK